MNAVNDNQGTPVARGLNVLLAIAMAVIVIIICAFVLFGVMVMTNKDMNADIVAKLAETGSSASPNMTSIALFGGALVAGAYLFVLNILRKIIKTLLAGDPFVPANISRLRLIWIIIALSEVFRIIVVNLSSGGAVMLDIRPGTWFLVFVIAALAEVFRHGAELRRDAELTI